MERQLLNENYDKVLELKRIDACQIIKGASSQPFIDVFIDFIKTFDGNMMEACDRSGDFYMTNISVAEDNSLNFYPAGNYRSTFRLFDIQDENIINATMNLNVVHK
ncbi:CLUMA_CG016124, isoform A [Clunio marinus]|uniref:CLUMA_CG016124, isoform A n=1 Tax=Clunio marinus TaxID=568069 RepID=A0A1J1ITY5_9DIPT|nr:CLUMA_CG016124, isoform A [Clunio marinus]